jgi:RND family efflux transporter MFP subunit
VASAEHSELRIDRNIAPARTYRRGIWLWLAGLALLVVVGAGWFALQPRTISVQTTPVVTTYPSQQFEVIHSAGRVVAQRKAAISSKASGRLEWLGVAAGSHVRAGDVIARLNKGDLQAQVEVALANIQAARAALERAQVEELDAAFSLKRTRDLIAQKKVSEQTLETAKEQADRAAATVASAKSVLRSAEVSARNSQVAVGYAVIRAPFDGIILSTDANVGDMVTPFSFAADAKGAVVNMADSSSLEVETDVSASGLSRVRIGQPCEIALDAVPDTRFRGTVSRIAPTVDRAKTTGVTRIRFDALDSRVLPEMSAKVSFLSQALTAEQQKPLIAVHPDALAPRDGRTVVFVVRDGKVFEVNVAPGLKVGELTAIAGEVKSGENVVLKPAPDLSAGAQIKARGN